MTISLPHMFYFYQSILILLIVIIVCLHRDREVTISQNQQPAKSVELLTQPNTGGWHTVHTTTERGVVATL